MIRSAARLAAALCALGTAPAFAQSDKEVSCGYQADIVSAIRQARLDRVAERKVPETILATGPTWPENYNAAIPLMTPWVYEMKRSEVKNNDLAAAWKELCLSQ